MIEHFDQHHDMQIPRDEPVQNVFGLLGKFLRKMKAENGDPELLYGTDPEVIQQFERYRPEHQQSITGQGIEGAKVLLEMLPACNQATFKCISFALSAVVRAKTNEVEHCTRLAFDSLGTACRDTALILQGNSCRGLDSYLF